MQRQRRAIHSLFLMVLLSSALGCRSTRGPAEGQERFEGPEQALHELVAALRSDDLARLRSIFGPGSEQLLDSGDEVMDRSARQRFVELLDARSSFEGDDDHSVTLYVGEDEWPFPVPIRRHGDVWFFDTDEGLDELLARRIGANELATIEVCRAHVDAQLEYASVDRDGDGILEYARKFRSSEGKQDGLYWPTVEGEPLSPLGPLAAEAVRQGYAPDPDATGPRPYHGYYYRILEGQDDNVLGDAYDYVVRGSMVGGFALVAWPAGYGFSGVKTFLVNHHGTVFEKDLGEDTVAIATVVERFAPDESWREVGN